jgi:hypothetical protein
MPCCNGADRGCVWYPERTEPWKVLVALFLPDNITSRESVQTSLWSGVTREPAKQTSRGVADMSAAATLAGAVPGRGNEVCLPQARIVKVSSGKPRRAEAERFDRTWAPFCCKGGRPLPPRPTGKQRHTNAEPDRTACPEAVVG